MGIARAPFLSVFELFSRLDDPGVPPAEVVGVVVVGDRGDDVDAAAA